MTEQRIDVIVTRHPDYETVTEIYIDGKPATGAHIWDFDPGAGCEYQDYADEAEMLTGLTAIPSSIKSRLISIHQQLRPTYQRWSTDRADWPEN